jgi:hypothetical protein
MSQTTEKPTRGEHLEPWRKKIRELFGDATVMTRDLKQKAITETVNEIWGVKKPADGEDDVDGAYASAMSAAGIFVGAQDKYLLPKLSSENATQGQMDLLNETFDVDGQRYKLGSLTPRQVRKAVLVTLRSQGKAIRDRVAEITKLLKSCPNPDKPILEQI